MERRSLRVEGESGAKWAAHVLVGCRGGGRSTIVLVTVSRLGIGVGPQGAGTHHEEEESKEGPHDSQQHRVLHATLADRGSWPWQLCEAFIVCAVALRLPQQGEESPHGHVVAPHTLTRVKSSISHLDVLCLCLSGRQVSEGVQGATN